jgi:hypothetical protein
MSRSCERDGGFGKMILCVPKPAFFLFARKAFRRK